MNDNDPRHQALMANGWKYNATTDRYAPPESIAYDFTLESAYVYMPRLIPYTSLSERIKRDPRRQEPQ